MLEQRRHLELLPVSKYLPNLLRIRRGHDCLGAEEEDWAVGGTESSVGNR